MGKKLVSLMVCANLVICVLGGSYIYSRTNPYTATEKDHQLTLPLATIQTVTKKVPVVQVITKEVPVVQPLRDFASYEELKAWLEVHGGIVLVADDNGIISLLTINEQNDCDDQARWLQEKAEKDGYRLSVQIVDTGYLCGVEVSPPAHMGNLAVIGNLVYFVDVTQSNMIIKVCELDGGNG